MEWCRLTTNFYLDGAVLRAGEAAEVLFLRCIAYSGAQETRGLIPKHVLPMLTPTKTQARVAALLCEELLVDEGAHVRLRSWDRHQEQLDAESERRRKDRERKADERRRVRGLSADVSADAGRTVRAESTRIEVEVEEEKDKQPPPEVARSTASFDTWWDAYPRKVGKRTARTAYERACRRATPDTILAGVRTFRDDPNRDTAYTPHPTTWLNRDGWLDEPCQPHGQQRPNRAEERDRRHLALIEHFQNSTQGEIA